MDIFDEIPLFSGLNSQFKNKIKEDMLVKNYAKESVVFYEGDQGSYLHILIEGSVKLYKTSPKGVQLYIHGLSAPAIIAEYPTLEKATFPATCEFVTDGVLGLLHIEKIYHYLENPTFSMEVIRSLAQKTRILASVLHQEAILSSEAKVSDLLLREPQIFSRLKNNEIAAILNLTPETFSRILTKLKKGNIITLESHQLTLSDREALEAIVETNKFIPYGACRGCIY